MIALSGFPDDFSIASTSSLGVPPGKFRSNRVNSGPGVEPGKPGTPTGMALSGNPCGTCCKTCWPNVGWHETRNPVASRTMICFIGLVDDCFVHKGTRLTRRNPAQFPAKSCQATGTTSGPVVGGKPDGIPSQRVARSHDLNRNPDPNLNLNLNLRLGLRVRVRLRVRNLMNPPATNPP